MLRARPTHVGRALADWLRRRHALVTAAAAHARSAAADDQRGASGSRAQRLRRLLDAARVTPYQLRRGWLW